MKLIQNYDIPSYSDKLLYNCVWFGNALYHHILCLASLFQTQLNPSVVLWTDEQSFQNLQELSNIFKNYDFQIRVGKFKENSHYPHVVFRSDIWRLQILKEWGGIYFDLDILFLRDISWFANYGKPIVQEGYPDTDIFNNAIMFYPKENPGIDYWLNRLGSGYIDWDLIGNVQKKYDDNFQADMIPNDVTDIGWIGILPCDSFFDSRDISMELMGNSYLYHWHNRWHKSVHQPGTLASMYWDKFVTPIIRALNP